MNNNKNKIDPKDLMAVERSATALFGVSISLIVLGFIIEKFELFLHLLEAEIKDKAHQTIPQLSHIYFYKYLGIAIIVFGVIVSIYTYIYYTKWIRHLENRQIDTDKNIYMIISIFVALIGVVLILSMIFF